LAEKRLGKVVALQPAGDKPGYRLEQQVGFLIRKAHQRHTAIFSARMSEDLTPMQWAALARVGETGPCSQNQLGRDTAMDAATIKGVVDRLAKRGLVEAKPDPEDARRLVISPTAAGTEFLARNTPRAVAITEETLAPLSEAERARLIELLRRIG
jgi:DNA-binding MarR family transcriptional regulator